MAINLKNDLSWIIPTIISAVLAIFLFAKGVNFVKRDPVYAVKHGPIMVFDSKRSSQKIQLLVSDSIRVEENVYVINIVIWNKGRETIKHDDVRKPIVITVADSSKILDFEVVEETHPGVSGFKLIDQKNKLHVDWDFFDFGYGFELQLIYSGDNPYKVNIDGHVLGAQIRRVNSRERPSTGHYVVLGIFGMLLLSLVVVMIRRILKGVKFGDLVPIIVSIIFMVVIFLAFVLDVLFGSRLPL